MNGKDITTTTLKHIKRIVVIVIGFTILFIGIIMIVLPGPAIIIIPLGLTILAGEFLWARKLLKKVKSGVKSVKDAITKK